MLRPTESPVVFLQQLGRGLRQHPDKQRLTVIDFVGNHQIFCGRIRRLLSLVSTPTSLRAYLECAGPARAPARVLHRPRARGAPPHLPPARCPRGRARLPRARPRPPRAPQHRRALPDGLPPQLPPTHARRLVPLRRPGTRSRCRGDARARGARRLARHHRAFWLENAVAGWLSDPAWFSVEDDRLVPRRLAIPAGLESAAARMTRELVDYRLQLCRARTSAEPAGNSFSCIVTWNRRDPILKLPDRSKVPDLPRGDVDARLPDGSVWTFRFASQFCNVARPATADRNRLPDLMRSWFGPSAGQPGTRFQVQFLAVAGWLVARAAGSSARRCHTRPPRRLPQAPCRGRSHRRLTLRHTRPRPGQLAL